MKANCSSFSAWLTTCVASPARIKILFLMLSLLSPLGGFAQSPIRWGTLTKRVDAMGTPSGNSVSVTSPKLESQPQPMINLPAGYTNLVFNYDSSTWNQNGGPNGGDIVLHGQPIGSSHWSVNQPNGAFWSASTCDAPGPNGYPFSLSQGYFSMGWSQLNHGTQISTCDTLFHGLAVKHGYYEMRFLVPVENNGTYGLYPGFWLQSIGTNSQRIAPEMDIFETFGSDEFASFHTTWHQWGPSGQVNALGFAYDSTGKGCECLGWTPARRTPLFGAGWHTIGCLIDSSNIHLYLDGREIWITPNPDDTVFGLPMFVNIQAGINPGNTTINWGGVPPFPGTGGAPQFNMGIKWVRVWDDPAEQ
jgi:hypothetical protein